MMLASKELHCFAKKEKNIQKCNRRKTNISKEKILDPIYTLGHNGLIFKLDFFLHLRMPHHIKPLGW
jgi:hypothetical protein